MSSGVPTVESLYHLGRFREIVASSRNVPTSFTVDQLLTIAEAMVRPVRLAEQSVSALELVSNGRQAPPRTLRIILGLVAESLVS